MAVERRKVVQALKKKGYAEEDGDHHYYRLYICGLRTQIYTKVSRDSKKTRTLGDNLVKQMYDQTKLVKDEFLKYVQCTLSHKEYLLLLVSKGHLQREDLKGAVESGLVSAEELDAAVPEQE